MRPVGARFKGMPRARPAPEHNVIQNPALTRALQRVTGLRQAHVQPALAEGLQPTISVGDTREDPRTQWPKSYAAMIEQVPAADVSRAVFINPVGNDTICVLRRLHLFAGISSITPGAFFELIYSYAPQIGTVLAPNNATRGVQLVSGYEWHPIGAPVIPPNETFDVANFPTPNFSKCGWHTPMIVPGIDGSYWWRGVFEYEYLEDFNSPTGPRYFVYPGGTWHAYVLSNSISCFWNMWWDEYPLR